MSHTTDQHDHGEAWDASDVRALREFLRRGWTLQQIADRMGRTYGAVNSRVYRMRRDGLL